MVALIALGGVLWTGRKTDQREFKKWRRETIVKLASDALVEVRNVENNYRTATAVDDLPYTDELKSAAASARKLNPISDQLRIVGAGGLADLCWDLRDAAVDIETPAMDYRAAVAEYVTELARLPKDSPRRENDVIALWMKTAKTAEGEFRSAISKLNHESLYFTDGAHAEQAAIR